MYNVKPFLMIRNHYFLIKDFLKFAACSVLLMSLQVWFLDFLGLFPGYSDGSCVQRNRLSCILEVVDYDDMILHWKSKQQENSEFENYSLINSNCVKITLDVLLGEKKARGIYSESINLALARCFQIQVRGRVFKHRKLLL